MYGLIQQMKVSHDDFELFRQQYEQNRKFNQSCRMYIEENRENGGNSKVLNGLIKEGGYQLIESEEYEELLQLQEY